LIALLIVSSLDLSNVGNALIEGLPQDLHIDSTRLLVALSINFATYATFGVPANIMLKLTTPRFWLPLLTFTWGLICLLTGVTQNYAGFIATRFFIGIVDSGLIPGCIFYMSMWYKRNEQIYRISLFLSCSTLAGSFNGLLAFAIANMRGLAGLNGWRWIFIMEGLFTVVFAGFAYLFVQNYPATARFLTPKEREHVIARLKADSDAIQDEKFTWDGVIQALKDPKVWLYGACFHTLTLPNAGLSLFLPTTINELGYTASQAQLLSVPPYFGAFLFTMALAVIAERTRRRAVFIIFGASLSIIGYIVFITSKTPQVAYGATFLALTGTFGAATVLASWPANNVSGQTKRAVAAALQYSVGNLGVIIGIQLYQPRWGPKFIIAKYLAIAYLVTHIVLVSTLWYILSRENARRDRGERDDRLKDVDAGVFLGDNDPRWRFQT